MSRPGTKTVSKFPELAPLSCGRFGHLEMLIAREGAIVVTYANAGCARASEDNGATTVVSVDNRKSLLWHLQQLDLALFYRHALGRPVEEALDPQRFANSEPMSVDPVLPSSELSYTEALLKTGGSISIRSSSATASLSTKRNNLVAVVSSVPQSRIGDLLLRLNQAVGDAELRRHCLDWGFKTQA